MNTTVKHILSSILAVLIIAAIILLAGEPTEAVKHPHLIDLGCLAAIYGFGKAIIKLNPELKDEEA